MRAQPWRSSEKEGPATPVDSSQGVTERGTSESSSRAMRPPHRTIRRPELRQIVPLSDTTIYEMEQRGEFPRRFYLTSRCVVWDLSEIEAWLKERRRVSDAHLVKLAPSPDVRQRRSRPVKR